MIAVRLLTAENTSPQKVVAVVVAVAVAVVVVTSRRVYISRKTSNVSFTTTNCGAGKICTTYPRPYTHQSPARVEFQNPYPHRTRKDNLHPTCTRKLRLAPALHPQHRPGTEPAPAPHP